MRSIKYRIALGLQVQVAVIVFVCLNFPVIAATSPSGMVSDDFSGSLNTSIWSFGDPLGDSSLSTTGTQVAISVPAGTEHNLWGGKLNAPRLLQKTKDTSFLIQTKIDSAMSQQYQAAGIIVEQDSDDLLRFGVYYDGTKLHIDASHFAKGDPKVEVNSVISNTFPIYLRVERNHSEHKWSYSYSYDGNNWKLAGIFRRGIRASTAGIYAANPESNPPAYTGLFDYFIVDGSTSGKDTTPPVINNIHTTVTDTTATLTWITDEVANSVIDYGLTNSYGSNTASANLVTSHSITLTGLSPAKKYFYRVNSTDASGNTATSSGETFTTQASSGGSSSGLVSDEFNNALNTSRWSFVDPLGDSNVSTTGSQVAISVPAKVEHNLYIDRLNAPRILQTASNTNFTVETKIDSVMTKRYQAAGLIVQQDSDDLIRFDVHYDGSKLTIYSGSFTNGRVNNRIIKTITNTFPVYLRVQRSGNQWTYSYSYNGSSWTTAVVFNHSLTVAAVGLTAFNPESNPPAYTGLFDYFRVSGTGGGGQPIDNTPPVISNIRAVVTDSTAKITWDTDENSSSVVDFGRTSKYGASSSDETLTTTHSIVLTGLVASTTYYYRVSSTDVSGNTRNSAGFQFTTDIQSDSPLVRWTHLSSATGDLPVPPTNTGQAGMKVVDLDKDGQTDYVVTIWGKDQMLLWYRHRGNKFEKYIIDSEKKFLSHTRGFNDIDNDGDIDLVIGDAKTNAVSWWENPYPNYNPNKPWVRRTIFESSDIQFHDGIWGDVDNDGKKEYITWNQHTLRLLLFEVPANPKTTKPWQATQIFSWSGGAGRFQYRGVDIADIDLDGELDFVGGCGWFKRVRGSRFIYEPIDESKAYGTIVAGQLVKGGRPEVVCQTELTSGPLNMYQWTGSRWQTKTLISNIDRSHTLEIGDINLDGNLDLLVAEMGHWGAVLKGNDKPTNPDAKLFVLYGDGAGNFVRQTVSTGQGHLEGQLGDIDDDGDLDIVSHPLRLDIPRVDIWINEGS